MGYHLIIRNADNSITAEYAESFEELAYFNEISNDSIVYQGERHWSPCVVGQSDRYKNLAEVWFRAGIKAQKLLKVQAIEHGLMIEEISQDVESFKAYTSNAEVAIKRGDFLIRNVKNIEVEAKCLTFYGDEFYIEYSHVQRHINMEKYSGSAVVLAIYERHEDSPKPDSLCMVYVRTIKAENNKLVRYDKDKKCLVVPRSLTQPGFTLIDQVRFEIEANSHSKDL